MLERGRQMDRQYMALGANPQTSPSIVLILFRISPIIQGMRNYNMIEVANPYGAGQFVWVPQSPSRSWKFHPLWLVVNDKIYAFNLISLRMVRGSIHPAQESDELWAEIGWDKRARPSSIVPILLRRSAEITHGPLRTASPSSM